MGTSEILLLHDGNGMVRGIEEALGQIAPVRRVNMLGAFQSGDTGATGAVICVNNSTIKNFGMLAQAFEVSIDESLFVMPSFSTEYASALKTLGVRDHLVAPVAPDALIQAVSTMRNRVLEARWNLLPPASRQALVRSRQSFKSVFDGVRTGKHVDIPSVEAASALIAGFAKTNSLEDWLGAIKDHHDYTYRHCMAVCGLIVHFANNIGIGADDLNLLSLGGMLHDIGKAKIPLSILDKPGKLDAAEQETMREHPGLSREIMASIEGLDPRIVNMAVHHHEKLDGTGYPDGLRGAQIDDLMRLTAIADVFSALIDERAYKPALSYEESFARMETMKDHLDQHLLARFKAFAMDARADEAA